MSQQLLWNGSGSGGITDVLAGIDRTTSIAGVNIFGASILIIIWLIVYFRLRQEPTRESVVGASFITLIVSVLLRALGAIQDSVFAISLVVLVGSMVLLINREG